MSDDTPPPETPAPGFVLLAGIRVSEALYKEIMDAWPADMPMAYLSMLAELGADKAEYLLRELGKTDKAWLIAPGKSIISTESESDPIKSQDRHKIEWNWDDPDLSLLPDDNVPALPFPVEIFGKFWADWCRQSASGVGASVNFTAGTLLAVVGGMLGNVRWAQGSRTWKQPGILWVALIGSSATSKSPSMAPVIDLVHEILERRRAEHESEADERDLKEAIALSMSKHWLADVHSVLGHVYKQNMPLPLDLRKRPDLGKPPKELVAHSLFFDDVTPEAVQSHAAGLPRGFMIKTDELSTWFGGFARYNNKSSQGVRGFWNKAFDGAYVSVARKGQDLRGIVRAKTDIPRFSVGLLGGTHPNEIKDLLSRDGRLSDDGMAHRILWIWGQSLSDDERGKNSNTTLPDDARALSALIALDKLEQDDGNKPLYVRATPEAEADLAAFKVRMGQFGAGANSWRRSSLNKAPGLALRISNALAHIRWSANPIGPSPEVIEQSVMRDAIQFVEEYCLPNADRLRQHITTADAEGDARRLLQMIREQRWKRFHLTDIKRHATERLGETRYRNDALEILKEAYLIRPDFKREGDTKGRLREEFLVNPQALEPLTA